MNRLGSRRSRGRSSFQVGLSQSHSSSKRRPGRSTQEAARAWVESLEIRQLLSSDLSVAITGPATAPIGGQAFYLVTVANNGPDDAQDVSLQVSENVDTATVQSSLAAQSITLLSPPPATPGFLAAGSSETFQVIQFVPQLATNAKPPVLLTTYAFNEEAEVATLAADPNSTNNFASTATQAVTTTTLKATVSTPSVVPMSQNSVDLTITVSNVGPNDAQNVVLTDVLPPQLTFQSIVQQSSGPVFDVVSGTPGSNSPVSAIASSMPAGSSVTFQLIAINANTIEDTPVTNQVVVSGMTVNGPALSTGQQSTIEWKFPTNLAVQLTGTSGILAGSFANAVYNVSVTDLGITFPTSATLTYTLPSGFALATVQGPSKSLPAIGSTGTLNIPISSAGSFQFTEKVDPSIPSATVVTHTATITTTPADDDQSDNFASLTTGVFDESDVAIAIKPMPFIPATGIVSYQLTVSNLGPSVASNVSFADILPPTLSFVSLTQTSGPTFTVSTPATGSNGTVSGQLATMLPGGSATFTLLASVAPSVGVGDSITNTATVSTSSADPTSLNNTTSVTSIAQTPADLSLTATGDANVPIGGKTTYVLTVTNNGPIDASNILLVDYLPSKAFFNSVTSESAFQIFPDSQGNVTLIFPLLAAGQSATFRINCTVGDTTDDGAILTNTASVTSSTPDSDPTNNFAEVDSNAYLLADLNVSLRLPSANIVVGEPEQPVKPTTVFIAGQNNVVGVVINNQGPGVAKNVQALVPLLPGVTFVGASYSSYQVQTIDGVPTLVFQIPYLDAGQSIVEDLTYNFDPSLAETQVTQTASVSSDSPDPHLNDNSASATVPVVKPADMALTIYGPTVARAGTLVQYVLDLSNVGDLNDFASGLVTFNIPANAPLVSIGSSNFYFTPSVSPGSTGPITFGSYPLDPGLDNSVEITLRIDPSVPDGSTIVPTATVTPSFGSDDPSNNSTSLTTKVVAQADVSVAMTGPASITSGADATYTITVTNNGPSDAQGVAFVDNLPAGLGFESIVQASGVPFTFQTPAFGAVQTVSGTGTLPAGTSAVFQLVGRGSFDASPQSPNTITNTVSVSTTTAGDDPSNNTASVTSIALTSADLSISINSADSVTAGTPGSFEIVVTNNGPSAAESVVVETVLPASETYVSSVVQFPSTVTVISNGSSGQTIVYRLDQWSQSSPARIDVNVAVDPLAPPTSLTNTASVVSTTPDPNLANNAASKTVQVIDSADLSVGVVDNSTTPPVNVGDFGNYEITVQNLGPTIAENVVVTDTLPVGVIFKSLTNPGNTAINLPAAGSTGTVSWTIPSLAPNAELSFDLFYQLGATSVTVDRTETVTVASSNPDPHLSNNTSSFTVTVTKPGDLSPTIFGPSVVRAGTLVNYVLTLSNNGDQKAGGGTLTFNIPADAPLVSIGNSDFQNTPNLPAGTIGPVTLTVAPGLAPGMEESIAFLERIDSSAADDSTITPTATVSPNLTSDNPDDNSASLTTSVVTMAHVTAAMTGPANITAGGTATYTITLTDTGPSDAQSVSFLDDLPTGMALQSITQTSGSPFSFLTPGAVGTASGTGTLPAGTSAVFQLVGMLPSSAPAALNAVTNTVSLSTSTTQDNSNGSTASVTSNVVTSADLSVSLLAPQSADAGNSYEFDIVVQNDGLSDATSVAVETVLPSAEGLLSSTDFMNGTVTTIDGGGSNGKTIVYTIPDLPAGQSDTIEIRASVDPFAPPLMVTNTASAISATPDPNLANNTASATVSVVTFADLRMALTTNATPVPILAGDTGQLDLKVTNIGPAYAQNVVVTDTLPVGASLVSITDSTHSGINLPAVGSTGTLSWNVAPMGPGAVDGFTLIYQLGPASEVPHRSDSATVQSSTFDPILSNNSATLDLSLQPTSLLLTGPTVARAGTFAQYGFTLTPSGGQALTIDVPLGAIISAVSAPPGYVVPTGIIGTTGIVNFGVTLSSFVVVISEANPASTPDGTVLTTSAWVNFDTSTTQSISTKIVAIADTAAALTGPSAIVPGTSASYTLKVTNTGPSDAQNVSFTDALPSGMTFQSLVQTSGPTFTLNPLLVGLGGNVTGSIATLPAGASATFTLVGNVPAGLVASNLTNTLSVTSPTTDFNSSNNSASVTTPVQPKADLGVTLSTGIGRVVAGNGFTYTITLTNAGPSVAQNVVLSEVLAPGVAFSSFGTIVSGPYTASAPHVGANGTVTFLISSIAPHDIEVFTVNATVLPSAPAGPLPSTATVSSSATDPNLANNTATDQITQAATSADVKITDSPPMMFIDHGTTTSPPVLHPVFVLGQNNTWVIDVTNSGPSDAQNVSWTSAVPAGVMFESVSQVSGPAFAITSPTGGTGTISGNIATLPAGQTAEFDMVFAQNGVADGGIIASSATVTSATSDPNTTNNTSTGNALAYSPGDLAVTVEGASVVRAGTFATFLIDITNDGELLAGGATVNFVIPANAPFVAFTGSSGLSTLPNLAPGTTGPVSFTLPAGLVSGGDANVGLRLFVGANVPDGTILAPTASLTGTLATDDPSNNTSTGNTRIVALGDLAVTQTGPASIVPGTTATYSFKVANTGPSDSQNVSFSDPLPAGMTFISLTQNSGPAFTFNPLPVGAGGNVSGSIATLPNGASATFTLVAMVAPSFGGASLTNTVSATSPTIDLNTANNTASVTSAIAPQADVGVSLVGGTVMAGSTLTYTLTATNNGPSDAQSVVLTDALPAGTGFNSIIQTSGPGSSIGGPHVGGSGNAVASIPTLPAHSSATYQVSVTVFSSTPAGPLPSSLAVTSTTADSNLANNVATDISTVTTAADLHVTDSAPMMIVDAGSTTSPPKPKPAVIQNQDNTFVIDIANTGPSDAQNVSWTSAVPTGLAFVSVVQASGPASSLNISLPAGGTGMITGAISTLPAGQTAEFDVVYLANGVSPGNSVSSTASATSITPDTNTANNTSTATAQVYAPADLAITVITQSAVRAGTFISHNIDVTNIGGIPAGGATITYVIPSNAPFVSFTGSTGFPSLPNVPAGTTGPITFTLPAGMAPGGDANISIRELVSASVPDGTNLAATASLSGLPASDNPSNNTSTANTRIVAQCDLAMTQTGPATVAAGAVANYQVKITNNGPSDSQGVSFTETLPQGIDAQVAGIVQNSGPAFTINSSGGSIATLAAGASATFTVSVQVGSDVTPGTVLTATATASTSTSDFNSANDSAQTNTTVQAPQPAIIAVPTGASSSVGPVATPSPIHGFGRTIHTTLAGFSGVVAQFIDTTPTATSSTALRFHVAINWGDGSLSAGTVTYDKTDGRWNVSGSHRYKKKGVYTITVIVQDSAGRQGTITSHAIVGPMLVTPLTKPLI